LILPACEKVGYVSRRASDTFKTAPITMLEASRDQILDADVVVALLTNPNPNLSLEIGLTLGLGKPIVLVISKWESIPLDLKPYHLVVNATAPDAVSKLAGLLIATRSRTPKTIWTRRKPVPNYSEWLRTIRTSKKGGEFEGLISDLLLSMKGVEVIGSSPTQELDSGVDLVIWNSSPSSPLSNRGSLVHVDC